MNSKHFKKDERCPICGKDIHLDVDAEFESSAGCRKNKVSLYSYGGPTLCSQCRTLFNRIEFREYSDGKVDIELHSEDIK